MHQIPRDSVTGIASSDDMIGYHRLTSQQTLLIMTSERRYIGQVFIIINQLLKRSDTDYIMNYKIGQYSESSRRGH